MELGRISGAKGGSDSALRIRGGAVEKRSFRQHHDIAFSRGAPRSVKTSNAASHYQKARSYPLGHVPEINARRDAFERGTER